MTVKEQGWNTCFNQLGLDEESVLNQRYQLIHRAASALLEARNVNANNALMLVHSFSETGKWFEDYEKFVKLFSLFPKKNGIVGPVQLNGINLYFGWVTEVLSVRKQKVCYQTERVLL